MSSPSHINSAKLDINELCVKNPAATYYMRASGQSMQDRGIFDGDILVVDRSLAPTPGDVVVAAMYGGFVVKEYRIEQGRVLLVSSNSGSEPVFDVTSEPSYELFGVVSSSIHSLKTKR